MNPVANLSQKFASRQRGEVAGHSKKAFAMQARHLSETFG